MALSTLVPFNCSPGFLSAGFNSESSGPCCIPWKLWNSVRATLLSIATTSVLCRLPVLSSSSVQTPILPYVLKLCSSACSDMDAGVRASGMRGVIVCRSCINAGQHAPPLPRDALLKTKSSYSATISQTNMEEELEAMEEEKAQDAKSESIKLSKKSEPEPEAKNSKAEDCVPHPNASGEILKNNTAQELKAELIETRKLIRESFAQMQEAFRSSLQNPTIARIESKPDTARPRTEDTTPKRKRSDRENKRESSSVSKNDDNQMKKQRLSTSANEIPIREEKSKNAAGLPGTAGDQIESNFDAEFDKEFGENQVKDDAESEGDNEGDMCVVDATHGPDEGDTGRLW
eukprot:CAMPEP_0114495584 /NCGR_PEP_ID=MMETSP0109-20121206/5291_1 /TAXON_ID=29199 /ORGANISM="Chlorarachnion reptans, Strain CCCM449" /LENGTH=345 /DNA_ID=CAMNT_0001672753 /DNA_START=108 /DNA_END=1142 /DNA_ORIENTATION=-